MNPFSVSFKTKKPKNYLCPHAIDWFCDRASWIIAGVMSHVWTSVWDTGLWSAQTHSLLTNSDKRFFTTPEGFTVKLFGHRRDFMEGKVAAHKYSNSQTPIFTWSMEAIKNEDRFYYFVRKSWQNKWTEIIHTLCSLLSVLIHSGALSVFTHLPSDILSRPSLLCTLWPFLLRFNTDMHLFSSNTLRSFKYSLCETLLRAVLFFIFDNAWTDSALLHCCLAF